MVIVIYVSLLFLSAYMYYRVVSICLCYVHSNYTSNYSVYHIADKNCKNYVTIYFETWLTVLVVAVNKNYLVKLRGHEVNHANGFTT